MVSETHLSVDQFILPLFVIPGKGLREPIASMPGQFRFSIDELVKEVKTAQGLGISAVILFGIPEKKDERASEAYAKDGIIQKAVQALKDSVPEVVVMTDVCLCEYMSHGHCGVVQEGKILNDPSLELLARTAVSHAEAGADMVAPSDMMDGRVTTIRSSLDQTGFSDVALMSYAVKYASAYYGPFREAAQSAPQFGDRKTYQMNPANLREAIREAKLDEAEGADIIMIKPALSYLDVIAAVRSHIHLPLAAYQVSGEYAQIKAAGERGWIDEKAVMLETLLSIRRAGADLILTYCAKEVAEILKKNCL